MRKDLQLIYLHFSFEKHVPSQVLKGFSVENLETTGSTFLSKFSSEIYLSRIINYWGSIFTLYLMWGAFSLVCVLSTFFFFLSLFFFFSFSVGIFLTDTNDSQDSRDVEEIIIFLAFDFHLLTNIHLAHRDFYHFFLIGLSVITRLRLVLFRDLFFICIFIDEIKSELLTSKFQSDNVRIWAHIKISPFWAAVYIRLLGQF